jgi:rhodanese-related sulfurtransferase
LELISREELKQKLDGGEDVKLLCTLGEWAYRGVHIVGSIHVDSREKAAELLALDDQIVVYCTNVNCPASIMAYQMLTDAGYRDVKRYAGGLEDWEAAGYPLEGELV